VKIEFNYYYALGQGVENAITTTILELRDYNARFVGNTKRGAESVFSFNCYYYQLNSSQVNQRNV